MDYKNKHLHRENQDVSKPGYGTVLKLARRSLYMSKTTKRHTTFIWDSIANIYLPCNKYSFLRQIIFARKISSRNSNSNFLPESSKNFTFVKNCSPTALQGISLQGQDSRPFYHVNALLKRKWHHSQVVYKFLLNSYTGIGVCCCVLNQTHQQLTMMWQGLPVNGELQRGMLVRKGTHGTNSEQARFKKLSLRSRTE